MKQNDKMHRDEILSDENLVQHLLEEQFPKWTNLPIRRVPSSGTENALYRLGDEMIVRLPRRPGATKPIDKEQKWLPKLAPLFPIAIPIPLGKGKPTKEFPYPWSIYKWLKGENPIVDHLNDPSSLAKDVAKFINILHQINLKDGPLARRGAPLEVQDDQMRVALKESHGLVDTDAVIDIWEKALKVPKYSGKPVWIHGDLSPGNILLVNGKLSAILDFGGLGVGDPAVDSIAAWNLLSAETRETFRRELQYDKETWARGRGWALSIALIQLPYYKDTNKELASNARHVINEILEEDR